MVLEGLINLRQQKSYPIVHLMCNKRNWFLIKIIFRTWIYVSLITFIITCFIVYINFLCGSQRVNPLTATEMAVSIAPLNGTLYHSVHSPCRQYLAFWIKWIPSTSMYKWYIWGLQSSMVYKDRFTASYHGTSWYVNEISWRETIIDPDSSAYNLREDVTDLNLNRANTE